MRQCETDLIIIGGGPAGLSAAINAASEGLTVRIIDSAPTFGGQARESNAIENYLGFPQGVTGDTLMSRAILQAQKFGNISFICPSSALAINRVEADHGPHLIEITTEDYQQYYARVALLANGLSYRRLGADNLGAVMGHGAYYGAPPTVIPHDEDCRIAIVGGANSAGQAAVKLAENSGAHIKMFVRKTLDLQMSRYLVDRIKQLQNIEVCEHCEITAVHGDSERSWLQGITYVRNDEKLIDGQAVQYSEEMDYLFIFIGAQPRTLWLRDKIELDENHYIVTGTGLSAWDVDKTGRKPFFFETSMPGVFAAGDVRAHSTKRIAAAIGEGSAVVSVIHQYLDLEK